MPGGRYSRRARLAVAGSIPLALMVCTPAWAQVTSTTTTLPPDTTTTVAPATTTTLGSVIAVPSSATTDFYTAVVAGLGVLVVLALIQLGLKFAGR